MKLRFLDQKGFATVYLAVLISGVGLAIALTVGLTVFEQQNIVRNSTLSVQSFLAAESGAEDALLRLVMAKSWLSPYSFPVGNSSANVSISDIVGGGRTIESEGSLLSRSRTARVGYGVVGSDSAFAYAAYIGEGGLIAGNNVNIYGDITSSGDVILKSNTRLRDTLTVAGAGKKLQGFSDGVVRSYVHKGARVDRCETTIMGEDQTPSQTLHANSESGCAYAALVPLDPIPSPVPPPITTAQLSQWEAEASAGGVIGDYTVSGYQATGTLGPKKIQGDLTVNGYMATLNVSGTLWVTGDVTIEAQDGGLALTSTYGNGSGVIISEGKIYISPGTNFLGSGQPGSYLMLLSTFPSDTYLNPSIDIGSGVTGDIAYASAGWILLNFRTEQDLVREVAGFGVAIAPDDPEGVGAIHWEEGLLNTVFTTGLAAEWDVTSWKETE